VRDADGIDNIAGNADDEVGLAGWTINLIGTDGFGNAVNLSTVTDVNGDYSFTVDPGSYTVSETQQAGWFQSFPDIPGDGDWDIVTTSATTSCSTSPASSGTMWMATGYGMLASLASKAGRSISISTMTRRST
jgi:hypothetical protein